MNVWRKKTVRWTLDGKRVSPNTPNAVRKAIPSKRYYGTLRTWDDRRRQVPLTEDAKTSTQLLRRLQGEEDRQRALGVDRYAVERRRPLSELLDEYKTHLRAKANTERHVTLTLTRINAIVDALDAKRLTDLDASRIASTLADWRTRKPISVGTSNHYARAIKGFSRWLWTSRKTPDDPLISLRLLNARVDRRHVRRALTPAELKTLVHATETSRKTLCGLSPTDRANLYLLAAYTGLRASELASLTPTSFDLETGTVNVQAAYSKRRRNDTLPLHASLLERLRPWLAEKTGTLWRGTWTEHRCANTARIFRRDLKRAGIAYVDEHGCFADFHALRHTFITQLARSGVHPLKAKELARHSTITLTMDVYSHVQTDELREALNTLPPLPL